jgi:hypothetical protein
VTKTAKGKQEAIRLFKQKGSEQSPQEVKFAVDYLFFFGYIAVDLIKDVSFEELQSAVKLFQRAFGIKADGMLDSKTIRAMEVPRCGCPDIVDKQKKEHVEFLRAQEIAAKNRDRWNKKGLTYFIAEYIGGSLTRENQRKVVASAFKAWDDVCGLDISEVNNLAKADIVLRTGRGPQHNFDGRGGTLAWAYLPQGNDTQLSMKFDLDETWVTQPKQRGVQLFNVACHEFGHLLGLTHSKKQSALMAPYYNPFIASPQQNDDIPRIQKLYGPNQKAVPLKNVRQVGENLTVELSPGQRLVVTCK